MNESLLKSMKVKDEQQRLKEKAKILMEQLEASKKKKEIETEKKLKEKIIAHYQSSFQTFKQELQEYSKGQVASLQLVKEFKMNQVNQFHKCVVECLNRLSKNLKESEEYEIEIEKSRDEAIQFLKQQKQKEIESVKKRIMEEKERKVKQFEESIEIE